MSMNMAELATHLSHLASAVEDKAEVNLRTLVQMGLGYMKREIQAVHAVDTGTMLNSVTSERSGEHEYEVGPTVDYATYVALGTSRMPARPFHITSAAKLQEAASKLNWMPEGV